MEKISNTFPEEAEQALNENQHEASAARDAKWETLKGLRERRKELLLYANTDAWCRDDADLLDRLDREIKDTERELGFYGKIA